MDYSIKVTNGNNFKWEKQSDPSEIYALTQSCQKNSRKYVTFGRQLLIPTRTTDVKDFAKDFFLPTTFNYGLKWRLFTPPAPPKDLREAISRIFMTIIFFPIFLTGIIIEPIFKAGFIVATVMCDVFTFPIRVVTCIPRYISNKVHAKEKNPFYNYLKSSGVDENLLKTNQVHVKLKFTGDGKPSSRHYNFNFIELPITA